MKVTDKLFSRGRAYFLEPLCGKGGVSRSGALHRTGSAEFRTLKEACCQRASLYVMFAAKEISGMRVLLEVFSLRARGWKSKALPAESRSSGMFDHWLALNPFRPHLRRLWGEMNDFNFIFLLFPA